MRRFQHLAILITLLAPPSFAAAQSPPPPPKTSPPATKAEAKVPAKEYVTSTKPIDAEGQRQISEFVSSRVGQILEGDPAQVRQATSDVLALLRQATATPVFRRAFADCLKPYVAKMVASNDAFRTINLLQIVQWTRTPEALDILIQQVTPSSQKDATTRIGASRLLPGCVTNASLTSTQIDSAARRIREAAEEETEWIACVHEMQSLAAMVVVAQDGKMAPQVELFRGEFLKVLRSTAAKISKSGGSDQVFALQRGLLILRDMLLKTSKDQIDPKTRGDIREITKVATEMPGQFPQGKTSESEALHQSASGAAIVAGVIDKLLGPAGG